MAILVNNSIFFPCRVDDIINHPDGGEEDEDDEEDLQVRAANVYVVVGTAAGQGTAQDQNVYTDDPGQHPSPVSTPLLRNSAGRDAQVGFTCALRLTGRTDVVGQVGLLRLLVFDRHPAWFTGIAIAQTLAWIASVQAHGCSLSKLYSQMSCLPHLVPYETLQV